MNLPEMPIVVFDMICVFAYGAMCKKDMFLDVAWVDSVQKSIPPMFLKPSVPTRPFFTNYQWGTWQIEQSLRDLYVDLYKPNPYRRGNPYFPTASLQLEFGVFSKIPFHTAVCLKNGVVRGAKKYKGSLVKRVRKLCAHGKIWDWNMILQECFSESFWFDLESFEPRDYVMASVIPRFVQQLRTASFLVSSDA